jgi:hypothetical protein
MERLCLSIAGEVRSPAIAIMKAAFILRSPPNHSRDPAHRNSDASRGLAANAMLKYHPRVRVMRHPAGSIHSHGRTRMFKTIAAGLLGATLLLAAPLAFAQQTPAPKKAAAGSGPKAGPGQKVCRHKFPDGTPNAWVCKKEEPCCAWDEIKYVKCGSVTFKCL